MISSEKIRSEIQSWVKFFWMIWSDNNNCIDYRKTKRTILFFPYVTNNINHFFKEKTILVGYRKLYKWFVRPSFKNNCRHPFRTNFLMKGNLTFIIYIYIYFFYQPYFSLIDETKPRNHFFFLRKASEMICKIQEQLDEMFVKSSCRKKGK